MKPEISFIIAVLNGNPTVKECLDSIFAQEYPKSAYEVLVIDGGSTDGTRELVAAMQETHTNLKLSHNPFKLSEGKGNGKDQGVSAARGKYLVFLDHDNILLHETWLREMLRPFKEDATIAATQSLLHYRRGDSLFLKYVNALGVEDPFAINYSLVAQVVLNPEKFHYEKGYYLHNLTTSHVLFGGANGCVFKKEVFKKIGGYTRDVDVFYDMAFFRMKVAVPRNACLYHKTSNKVSSFMLKKGKYYYRFIKHDYSWKKYRWAGNDFRGKIRFWLQIASNLSFIVPFMTSCRQFIKNPQIFWLLHPFYTFFITLEYGLITLFFMKNYLSYIRKS